MKKIIFALSILLLITPSLALTDYQQGVLDGLNRGWHMAQRYDQAIAGDPAVYNQAVPEYNQWILTVFGQNETMNETLNESLMLKPIGTAAQSQTAIQSQPYFIQKTIKPVHEIDASWNQTSLVPQPDASGRIQGLPAEVYNSWGPALVNF